MANREIQGRSETEKNIHIKKAVIYYKCVYKHRCTYKYEDKKTKRKLCNSQKPCRYRVPIAKFGEQTDD